ncbi:hypothetical protein [Mycobacterium marseillense]|uniref:hypothetical protein n=1 Tax=Mycobacterium marseillense TaxID=701042 RepID=UPI0012FDAAD2|nr:hypothetical protein [Mycobacterium marseillense]
MTRLLAAGTVVLALGLACAAPAMADPTPPGYVQCGDQLVPADPRVSVRDPWGTLMYEQFLQAFCPPPSGGAR